MLLSQMIRSTAITRRTDAYDPGLLGRQGGRWAQQWVTAALPAQAPQRRAAPADLDERLADLRRRGVVTDDELARLRAQAGG
jgi:hypothetical protein